MEPEEEIAEAEFGEQRRLGTARRVSARTPSADSVRCRREVRIATVPGFFPPAEEECWETDSESDGWVTDDEPDTDFDAYYDSITAAHAAGDDARFTELVFAAAGDGGSFSDEEGSYFSWWELRLVSVGAAETGSDLLGPLLRCRCRVGLGTPFPQLQAQLAQLYWC